MAYTLHSKPETPTLSEPVKVKVGVLSFVAPEGPAVMEVSGGVVSLDGLVVEVVKVHFLFVLRISPPTPLTPEVPPTITTW